MRRAVPRLILALTLLSAAPRALATDTAFWKPYAPDEAAYGLFHFDQADLTRAEVKAASAESVGKARFEPAGRFGGCLALDGASALKVTPAGIFAGPYVAIEAWVKLAKYPAKEAYIVHRPAVVDANTSAYDPKADRTKGFSLLVDSQGRLHLETTNLFYGTTTRTSSPPGAVPLGKWVHLAGISAAVPVQFRRLYVDGRQVQMTPLHWGEGLMVSGDEESQPGPYYIGNSAKGDAGLAGLIDEVRIHRRVVRLWEKGDMSWARGNDARAVPLGRPYLRDDAGPAVYLSLDGDLKPGGGSVKDAKVAGAGGEYVPGVRGKAYFGRFDVNAAGVLDMNEGTIEFWAQPVGMNNYSDCNQVLLHFGGATFYTYNTGVCGLQLPLSLHFTGDDGDLRFISAEGIAFHPGRWYHMAIAWDRRRTAIYVDGKRIVEQQIGLATKHNGGRAGSVIFNPNGNVAEFDEVHLYGRRLLDEEVANARGRYVAGYKFTPVPDRPVEIRAEYLPSQNRVCYQLAATVPAATIRSCSLVLRDGQGRSLATAEGAFTEDEQVLAVPALPDGTYTLEVAARMADGRSVLSDRFVFLREHFPWEGNKLGLDGKVYPPFQPIEVAGDEARVVLRKYRMNGFGLWDKAVSLDRDILSAPIVLRYRTREGEGAWTSTGGKFTLARADLAVYEAKAAAPPVAVEVKSSIEVDGCMKVEMALLPGARAEEIQQLWLEIPLNDADAPLMHTVDAGVRQNYSGATPAGTGMVWDGSKAHHYIRWLNAFVPYVWLGAEERGLAWFAENDKGWITAKSWDTPVQQLVREGTRLTLRVYLVNTPAVIRERHELVFGLQASPTKPMPSDWRRKLPDIPVGLAVTPWGGLHCSYQGPYRDDWTVADKLVEARLSGKADADWFARYERDHNPPLVHGNWGWAASAMHFAGRCVEAGPNKPIAVYQEEMAASRLRPEWDVFMGEWGTTATFHRSTAPPRAAGQWPDDSALRDGDVGETSARVTFPASYRDFGAYFSNQWLRRGVSLYWDNTYPNFSLNHRTSAAYRTEQGVQPAMIIWNQREYHKRVWNLLGYWRTKRKEPLEWVLHMTNTLLLPVHTWGTVNLDHELTTETPFRPDWLRTETIGRQVGNMPLSLYPITGTGKALVALPAEEKALVEWGMRAVHEIQPTGGLEKALVDFGYGTPAVTVHNYWSGKPAMKLDADVVKWLLLARPADRSYIVVLASWAEKPLRVEGTIDAAVLGFDPNGEIRDLARNADAGRVTGGRFSVELKYPYQVKCFKIAPRGPGGK